MSREVPMSADPDGTGPRELADGAAPEDETTPEDEPAPPVSTSAPSPAPPPPGPPLPAQSSEDTDVGWGDYGEQNDDWLLRDRPPHWDR